MFKLNVEITGTFVRRDVIQCNKPTIRARVRAAKAWAGWQGIRCFIERVPNDCETLIIRPRSGMCQVLFVSFVGE